MADVKTAVIFVVAVLSVFLQPGVKPQPTIGFSSAYDSCSHLEEEWEFQVQDIKGLKGALEIERQTVKTLENASSAKTEENHRLKLELENNQRVIETLKSVTERHRPGKALFSFVTIEMPEGLSLRI